jgi:hypothetical protein
MQLGGVQLGNEDISGKIQEPSSAGAGVSHLSYMQRTQLNVRPIVQQCFHCRE